MSDPSSVVQPFAWSVILPARGGRRLAGTSAKGALRIVSAEGEHEREIPLGVARSLERLESDEGARITTQDDLEDRLSVLLSRCAQDRVASLLDRRDYSASEVRERLRRDGYPPAVCEAVVARSVGCGLISDERYADMLIRSRLAAGWGRRRIEQELVRRGVDAAVVPGWPQDYLDKDDEEQRALAVARTRRIAERNGYEKLVRYLSGRGYELSLAMRVARQVVDESLTEEE